MKDMIILAIQTPIFMVLLPLTILDFTTGIIASVITKTTNSKIGRNGILIKILIYLSISAVSIVQLVFPQYPWITEVFVMFFIINEVISILENLTRSGVPLPDSIVKLFDGERDKLDKRPIE